MKFSAACTAGIDKIVSDFMQGIFSAACTAGIDRSTGGYSVPKFSAACTAGISVFAPIFIYLSKTWRKNTTLPIFVNDTLKALFLNRIFCMLATRGKMKKKQIGNGSLHSILISKRANVYYLEKCRIVVNGGRVEYLTSGRMAAEYYNIPIANTSVILLGTGTSISSAAARELALAGVCFGFCGGNGTPLFTGSSDVLFQIPQNEYRKTCYLQGWCSFWFDDEKRLAAAKDLQIIRLNFTKKSWSGRFFDGIFPSDAIDALVSEYSEKCNGSSSVCELLGYEGDLTSRLYGLAAKSVSISRFSRAKNGSGIDAANKNLDAGNYIAYGLAASALWVLGIPHSLPLLHGKTRRGGLVFDVADIVKDGIVLPSAFLAIREGLSGTAYRNFVISRLMESSALDEMIDAMKNIINKYGSIQSTGDTGLEA